MLLVIRKSNLFFEKVLYTSTWLSTALFISVVILSILARYIFKTPILGAIELSRLSFVWACFLGAALAYQRNAHIAIGILVDNVPQSLGRGIDKIIQVLSMAFFALLIYYSIWVNIFLEGAVLPMLGISQSWFYRPLPIIFLTMFFFSFEKLLEPK